VFLSENDLEKLIAQLKMDRNAFIKKFCRWVTDVNGKKVLSLREKSNKDCILWDSECTVYNTRPLQCRSFPFWKSIVSSAGAWAVAASGCPGMNYGKMHSQKEIGEYLKMRITEPIINR
jgi:Fe-S-cluster containining protein